jgi:hypothetical protein
VVARRRKISAILAHPMTPPNARAAARRRWQGVDSEQGRIVLVRLSADSNLLALRRVARADARFATDGPGHSEPPALNAPNPGLLDPVPSVELSVREPSPNGEGS